LEAYANLDLSLMSKGHDQMSSFDFVQPELDTQAHAEKRCDLIAEVRPPSFKQNCYVMQLPNGKYTYLVGSAYPLGMLARLNARVVSTRHIGETWELFKDKT
jgi:hypothetical protein